MGIEYVSASPCGEDGLTRLREALKADARYEVLPSGDTFVRLRVTKYPARETWPQDIEVHFQDRVYVLFHASHRDEREEFLRFLGEVLACRGLPCAFEEA